MLPPGKFPSPSPYRNNLRVGDPVLDTRTGHTAVVTKTPHASGRKAQIRRDQRLTKFYVPISVLRFIDYLGQAETVPPCDGTPPTL